MYDFNYISVREPKECRDTEMPATPTKGKETIFP